MFNQERVEVYEIGKITGAQRQGAFLQELESKTDKGRLRLVLNCSGIRELNRTTVLLLLSCLELAMMCNGDVRLAAVSPLVEAKLRQVGISRLFELHATTEGAILSYNRRSYSIVGLQDETFPQVMAAAS